MSGCPNLKMPSRSPRCDCVRGGGTAAQFAFGFVLLCTPQLGLCGETPLIPAEEVRLNSAKFREGLRQRGLTDLLELHLTEFAPASAAQTKLLMRDVKLAEFEDQRKPQALRLASLAEANRLLEDVLAELPDDPRRFEWKLTLAHSLLYQQAEPLVTSILYRNGGELVRERLSPLTKRALSILGEVSGELTKEQARVDELPARDFDKLEANGFIDSLDRSEPRCAYLKLWGGFFDAIAHAPGHPLRARRLHETLKGIQDYRKDLGDTLATLPMQAELSLLSGMVQRRLNDAPSARQDLDAARSTAERIDDSAQRRKTAWIVNLATMERARTDADDGKAADALSALGVLRGKHRTDGITRDLALSLAMVEREVHLASAARAARADRKAEATRARESATQAVGKLIAEYPDVRESLYAAVVDTLEFEPELASLDSVELCALVARSLFEANQEPARSNDHLSRAVAAGERFLLQSDPAARGFVPDVLFNLGVCEYRLGRLAQAAGRFLEIASNHRGLADASRAAALAVQVSHEACVEATSATGRRSGGEADACRLHADALAALSQNFPISEPALAWQFHYARSVEEQGRLEEAVRIYASVEPSHDRFVDALFARARCAARLAKKLASDPSVNGTALVRWHDEFSAAERAFVAHAERVARDPALGPSESNGTQAASLAVWSAEMALLPQIGNPAEALAKLATFEERFPKQPALLGDVWRVRLSAYERMDRLDDAAAALKAYVAADPANVGPALQTMYVDLIGDSDPLALSKDGSLPPRRAELALVLAQEIAKWAESAASEHSVIDRRTALLQLAEAQMRAGKFEAARAIFDRDFSATPLTETPVRVLHAYAECLYQLRDHAGALPKYNQLATAMSPNDPARWRALLRDLQCRTALDHPADGVLRVIRQQRFLYPELGGAAMAAQLEQLERENERRPGRAQSGR